MSWLLALVVGVTALGRSVTVSRVKGRYQIEISGHPRYYGDKVLALAAREAYHAMRPEIDAARTALVGLDASAPFEEEAAEC